MEVIAFTEQYLGAVMDFATRSHEAFPFSWEGREELFRWKYLEQVNRLRTGEHPCWIAVEDGRVVGFLGSMASDFWFAGEEMDGNAAMDLYLEDACRGKGVGKEMLRLYEESARLKLMLVSSEQAHNIYLHRGYQDLPGIRATASMWSLRCGWHWLLRKAGIERFELEPAEGAGRMRDWMLTRSNVSVLNGHKRELVNDFLVQSQRRFSLAPRRSVEYLEWKYRNHPDRHGEVFTLSDDAGLCAIFALANRSLGGPPMLVIGDVFLRDHNDRRVLRKLVDWCRELVDVLGAHAAGTFGCWTPLNETMQEALASRNQVFRCSILVDDCATPADTATAYISAGDGDYIR